jgi:6-pyruvoyltetrahydropterin/6-carboxytetrahydropterin synthase
MKWEIDKTFEFCYGHRVWTQTLNADYADNLQCACRHRHGHEARVQVYLTSNTLDNTGMITDFRHLEWLKKFLNTYVDHKFIVDIHDPAYEKLIGSNREFVDIIVPGTNYVVGYNLDLSNLDPKSWEYELDDGVLVVDFVPTSENLSKWLADLADAKMSQLNVSVSHVDWWETPKSRSRYYRTVCK